MLESAGDGNDLASLIIAGKIPILRIPEPQDKKVESSETISGPVRLSLNGADQSDAVRGQ